MMYEELVQRMREIHPEEFGDAWDFAFACQQTMHEAADAIEELSLVAESNERSAALWAETAGKAVEQIPRWIPVTEQLPEKNQIVVAHEGKGTWDFGMFRGISASGNPEYWHWKKNTFKHVKWWMPKDGALPEPPKEET